MPDSPEFLKPPEVDTKKVVLDINGLLKPKPGQPEPSGDEIDQPFLWVMYFRQGNDPKKEKVFKFSGTLQEARKRADDHCKFMGFILNFVKPFISDLDWEEDRKRNS